MIYRKYQFQLLFQMSKARTQIHESLSSIILFLRIFKTFQIGELVNICQLLQQQPLLYQDKTFSRMIAQFIYHVNQENKKNHTQQEYMSLMITQSLIYNLYRQNMKSVMNSSIYSNSLLISSTSQIGINDQSVQSIKHYDSIQDHFTGTFVTFVEDLVSDTQLFKKIKQMIQRGARRSPQGTNKIQKFADIMLDTLEYILNKQGKLDKIEGIKYTIGNKNTKIGNHMQKKNLKSIISQVNKVIFSSKLNRIVFMLEEAHQKIYLSLIHIYFAHCPEEEDKKGKIAKYFSGINYSGEDMLLNLTWAYVQSIRNKNQLFESSKNPLFRLIQANLHCFYMSVFRSFNQIVQKCCKYDFMSAIQFYKIVETTINKDLADFIEMLPYDLVQYLKYIYRIVLTIQSKGNKKDLNNISSIALTGVKKLLIYSLLVKPNLIQTYYAQGFDLNKYQDACNHLINLFFRSSIKKYQNNNEDCQFVSRLVKSISGMLDQRIIGNHQKNNQQDYQDDFQKLEVGSYILEDPVLNHEYQVLWQVIKNIQFTPKDLKQFQMHKNSQLTQKFDILNVMSAQNLNNTIIPNLNMFSPKQLSSPMHWPKKESLQFNQSIQYIQHLSEQQIYPQKQQIDFLTWMTVGGNRDYGSKPTMFEADRKKKKQRKEFVTFPRQKIREISSLYQQYKRILS